jgi:uncharacterized protein YndB with AHSA1/START domain
MPESVAAQGRHPWTHPTVVGHHPGVANVQLTVTIDRPLADVFRVLSTPEITPRWSANAIEEHTTTPGPAAIGSRRRATVRRFGGGTTENEIEVTEFEPNGHIAVRSIESPVPFTASWSFTEVDGGTRVDWRWDFALPRWLRPVGGVLSAMFAGTMRRDLQRLKSMMEAGEL